MPFIPGAGVVQSAMGGLVTLEGARDLAGQEFADFSGGLVATGSAYYNERPQWEFAPSFSIGTTTVPQRLYEEVTGRTLRGEGFKDHPAVNTSWNQFADYYRLVNERLGSSIVGFPTSLEWTAAASVVVNVRDLMEARGIRAEDLPHAADEWLENFFTEPGGTIYTDKEAIVRVANSAVPLSAYLVYGTASGRLGEPGEEAWYAQSGTAPVDWGKPSRNRLHGVAGGVWELVGDGTEWRGGSWAFDDRGGLRVALRIHYHYPHYGDDNLGSRPAALRQDSRKV